MGTEYYIIKPATQEIFYLGKSLKEFGGFPRYHEALSDYSDFDEFFWDVLQENKEFFFTIDFTLQEISELLYYIYEWSSDGLIRLANDCEEDAEWLAWEESGSVFEIMGEIEREKLSEEVNYN